METTTERDEVTERSAPLEGARAGRLQVRSGISECTLRALPREGGSYREDASGSLFVARAKGREPRIESHAGIVEVDYRGIGFFGWRRTSLDLALHAGIPWDIEVRGGASHVRADLHELRVRRVEIRGGASDVRIVLGAASGRVPIEVRGGAGHVEILHPRSVAARLRVRGGASEVSFDRQRFGAIGGHLVLATPSFDGESDGFDIEVGGGANGIEVVPLD